MSCVNQIDGDNAQRRAILPGRRDGYAMFSRVHIRWNLTAWSGFARSMGLVCWAAAALMTCIMGWSAWRAVDTASADVDRVVARNEAGIVSKGSDLLIAPR